MITLQIHPKMAKSNMGKNSGGDAFMNRDNDRVFSL